jgi:uncharacterized membrane protein
MRNLLLFFITIAFASLASAQEAQQDVPMADALRSDGKIWVVIATIVIVWAGVLAYLIRLDGRISKLENKTKA